MIKPEVIAVVGAQWGDEGKGKIVDYLAQDADVVIRAQGGDNAGHTVINGFGKFALHLVPAGIFNSLSVNIIGSSVVLNLETLLSEVGILSQRGIDSQNLFISSSAHLVFEYHKILDELQEQNRGSGKIGTTGHGIGPAYMDKAGRVGVRAELLGDPDELLFRLDDILKQKRQILSDGNFRKSIEEYLNSGAGLGALCNSDLERLIMLSYDSIPEQFYAEYYEKLIWRASETLSDKILDTGEMVQKHLQNGSTILIEGAHGTLLDIDYGTYPFVTSSSTSVPGLLQGCSIPPQFLTKSIGVFKAYQTRVGEGPMPTEINDEQGKAIREKGREFGTTTGRPRRIGSFDKVAAAYAQRINGFTHTVLTRLDILSGVGDLKVCSQYKEGSRILSDFPADSRRLSECRADYTATDIYKGWDEDLSGIEEYDDLPENAKRYIIGILGSKPYIIGVGEKRYDIILNTA